MSSEASSSSMSVFKSKTAKKFKSRDACNDVNEGESQDLPQEMDRTQSLEEVVSDVSPEETALSIDHIREFIFHLLDKPTLFKCRKVCHRWKYFASKELQKTVTFILEQVNPDGRAYSQRGVQNDPKYSFIGLAAPVNVRQQPDPSRSVSRLIALLENSTKSEFPCISVYYSVSNWINPQSFFDTYGPHLKKLKLISLISPRFGDRPILFKDLQKILSAQVAPNVEHLIFKGEVVFQKTSFNENKFKNTQYDAEFSEGLANLSLSHLKILEIRDEIHETILQMILEASPNLSEVKMTRNEFLHCLVRKPGPGTEARLTNWRHLLKELTIHCTEKSLESLEIFANANGTSANRLAIQKLCLDSAPWKNLIPRFSAALCKILEGCSASLEELTWGQMEFLTGLQFPPMTNVTKIIFCYTHEEYEDSDDGYGRRIRTYPIPTKFFPTMNHHLGTTFPNLKHVEFRAPPPVYYGDDDCGWEESDDPYYDGIEISMNQLFQNVEPVESVTRVELDELRDSESLRALFPNATFTGICCQQGDY